MSVCVWERERESVWFSMREFRRSKGYLVFVVVVGGGGGVIKMILFKLSLFRDLWIIGSKN